MTERPRLKAMKVRHSRARGNPAPSSAWIPFFNGMTVAVRQLDAGFHRHDGILVISMLNDFQHHW
jgi:hypothetical protein